MCEVCKVCEAKRIYLYVAHLRVRRRMAQEENAQKQGMQKSAWDGPLTEIGKPQEGGKDDDSENESVDCVAGNKDRDMQCV